MITAISSSVPYTRAIDHPPVNWPDLQPGDWFVFDPGIGAEVWMLCDVALGAAVHLRTGRHHWFHGSTDDTQLWRVQAAVTLSARPPFAV